MTIGRTVSKYFMVMVGILAIMPVSAGDVIQWEEDLRLGSENGEEYLWTSSKAMILVDAQGGFYVSDPGVNKIYAYSKDGTFLKTVAQGGNGPGELAELQAFEITPEGALVVDLMGGITARLQFFDKNMAYTRAEVQSGPPLILQNAVVSPTGKHFASFFVSPDSAKTHTNYKVSTFDTHLNEIQSISHKQGPMPEMNRFGEANYWVNRIGTNLSRFFEGIGIANFDAQGRLYTAESQTYKIKRWDVSQKDLEQVFQKAYKPEIRDEREVEEMVDFLASEFREDPELARILTRSVIQKAVEAANLPAAKNPLCGIIPLPDGAILAVTHLDLGTRENRADYFTKDGTFVGTVSLPDFGMVRYANGGYLPKLVFRGEYAYSMQLDENEEQVLVRYKYKINK